MTIQEAIQARHSVRQYIDKPITEDVVAALKAKIDEVNAEAGLHIQLILNEPKSFQCAMAKYGHFSGVNSYLVMAGKKTDDLDEKVGYYGEQIVLLAQMLGLNTCWVGVSYSKVPNTYVLEEDEKITCYISLGYGTNQGVSHKIKSVKEVSNASDLAPKWFLDGVKVEECILTLLVEHNGGRTDEKQYRCIWSCLSLVSPAKVIKKLDCGNHLLQQFLKSSSVARDTFVTEKSVPLG